MKERVVGAVLLGLIMPLAVLGCLLLCVGGLYGPTARARAGVRALDHFVNATLFNGYAWESVSSHAWRCRERRWARGVIWLTDRFDRGHCERANRREQPVVDLVQRKKLDRPTIV